jgi:hypothetical protein
MYLPINGKKLTENGLFVEYYEVNNLLYVTGMNFSLVISFKLLVLVGATRVNHSVINQGSAILKESKGNYGI